MFRRSSPKREAKRIYTRLMATLPEGKGHVIGVPIGVTDASLQRKYDDRNILHGAFRFRDYELIPVLDSFGTKYGYRMVDEAVIGLREIAPDFPALSITESQISSFASLSHALRETVYRVYDRNGIPAYVVNDFIHQFESAMRHVLLFPEDCPHLEGIVRQGVFDSDKALEMLAEIKENKLVLSISEGFL